MKNILESLALLLVTLLSMAVIVLIVLYNMIDDDSIDDISTIVVTPKKAVSKTSKSNAYLKSLEGYGDDVDVKVDVHKEDHTNEVIVTSELEDDELDKVVEDQTKSAYTQNLEHYVEVTHKVTVEKAQTPNVLKETSPKNGEAEKLPQDEIEDEIGMAIDAVLDDL